MCFDCWKEYYPEYKNDVVISQEIINAANLIEKVYEYHSAGGGMHVVIDDWNLEDDTLDFCKDYINKKDYEVTNEQRNAEMDCYRALKQLSIAERATSLAIQRGFIKITGENNDEYSILG